MKYLSTTICALLALSACADRPIPTPTLSRDLSVRPPGEAPTIPLSEIALETQADFDALEERTLPTMGVDGLSQVYRGLADGADPAAHPSDALLLMRLALLELRGDGGSERLQRAFAIADRLRTGAPKSPHGSYLVAQITRLLLRPGADHAFEITGRSRDVAKRLEEHLRHLLTLAPDYDGPGTRDAKVLEGELAALRAALSAAAAPADAPANPHGVMGARASDEMVAARRELTRYETGTNVDRITLCRDQVVDGFPATDHAIGQWLLLRCAVSLEMADRGFEALGGLVSSGAITDACTWAARLTGAGADQRTALDQALEKQGKPPCARP
jgi:hypothetical protein